MKKQQVPYILSQIYRKHGKVLESKPIDTKDLPAIGSLYRDNVTGYLWEVFAHAGGDTYVEENRVDYYESFDLRQIKKEDRVILLKSVAGALIYVTPEVFRSDIPASEHYEFVSKVEPTVKRFELAEFPDEEPIDDELITVMSTEKVIRKLTKESTTSLYILNVYTTNHGLTDLLIEYKADGFEGYRPIGVKIAASWVPQDLLMQIPRTELLNNIAFRKMLDSGMIVAISKGSAKRILETPECEEEIERLGSAYAEFLKTPYAEAQHKVATKSILKTE